MSIAAVIDRMDDWINPIVIKELRQAVKSRMVLLLVLAFLGLQLFIVGTMLLFSEARNTVGDADWTAGRNVFMVLQGMLLITLMLLVPAYACIRLAGERAEQNVDLLFISTLRPHSIIAGKFFGALMLAMLIFSACAPFMTFTYLLRGIDIPTILIVLGIDLLCMLFGTMTALFLAAVPGGRAIKFFFCFVGFVALTVTCFMILGMTMALIEGGIRAIDNNVFWIVTGLLTGGTLGLVGLLFFYAVCIISPASSNRVLPIRICLLAMWLVTGLAVCISKRYTSTDDWVRILIVWIALISQVLQVQLLISICERDQMGPRLARQVPRRWWLRWPAFFIYTGAANGLAFTLILLGVTWGLAFWWLDSNLLAPMWAAVNATVRFHLVCLGYVYCYGMTAVLVRVYLLSGQIRPGFTWLVALLLTGLGSSIPAIIAYVLFPEQVHSGNEGTWWKLSSPIIAYFETSRMWGERNADFEEVCLWFLAIWAVLVSVLNLPWFIRQVRAFQPRIRQEVAVAAVAEPAAPAAVLAEKPPSDAVIAEAPATSVQPG